MLTLYLTSPLADDIATAPSGPVTKTLNDVNFILQHVQILLLNTCRSCHGNVKCDLHCPGMIDLYWM